MELKTAFFLQLYRPSRHEYFITNKLTVVKIKMGLERLAIMEQIEKKEEINMHICTSPLLL
jgi:hypothetical protein